MMEILSKPLHQSMLDNLKQLKQSQVLEEQGKVEVRSQLPEGNRHERRSAAKRERQRKVPA